MHCNLRGFEVCQAGGESELYSLEFMAFKAESMGVKSGRRHDRCQVRIRNQLPEHESFCNRSFIVAGKVQSSFLGDGPHGAPWVWYNKPLIFCNTDKRSGFFSWWQFPQRESCTTGDGIPIYIRRQTRPYKTVWVWSWGKHESAS